MKQAGDPRLFFCALRNAARCSAAGLQCYSYAAAEAATGQGARRDLMSNFPLTAL